MKPARAPEAAPPEAARPLILVVEDDDAMRTLLAEVLAPLDATVASARNGAQAATCSTGAT
jgi:CheY-like chemotaxis protein